MVEPAIGGQRLDCLTQRERYPRRINGTPRQPDVTGVQHRYGARTMREQLAAGVDDESADLNRVERTSEQPGLFALQLFLQAHRAPRRLGAIGKNLALRRGRPPIFAVAQRRKAHHAKIVDHQIGLAAERNPDLFTPIDIVA